MNSPLMWPPIITGSIRTITRTLLSVSSPFFAIIAPRFVTWVLTIWLPMHAALILATAVIVMRLIAYVLAKHFTTILW